MKRITIAIDGHSSCGKSTMAKSIAQELGYTHVDSGAMYRAVALFALQHGLKPEEIEAHLAEIDIHGLLQGDIRSLAVSQAVSPVAAQPAVRTFVTDQLQRMGEEGGIVMDGRDIGTTVFPHAELKIFVTASAEVRAQRRYDELCAKGQECSFEEILTNVKERDYLDSHRAVSPLRQAPDAVVLDNSHMTIEEQKEWLLRLTREVASASE